jgi:hypothetical protein
MDKQANSNPGHETTDVPARPLASIGIAIVVLVGGSFLTVALLFKVLDYYQPLFDSIPHPLADSRQMSSAPRIQTDPPQQKAELHKIENHLLTTYDWVDQDNGLVRIPINRAIQILAERKLPVKTGNAATN